MRRRRFRLEDNNVPNLTAADFPESFRRIEMVLAREPGHPAGDAGDRYTFVVPLDTEGRLDREVARHHREKCRVVRREPGGPARIGHLIGHGSGWAIRYEDDGAMEQAFRLATERFVPGEYISIEAGGGLHSFRVVSVGPI